MHDLTLSDVDRLALQDEVQTMTEDAFRAFYDATARPLWAYLARATGDRALADDLLQESYYRFVRVSGRCEDDEHRRAYLFRIAINLVRDTRRRSHGQMVPLADQGEQIPDESGDPERLARRADVARALSRLKPRDRDLLWAAYALGVSHAQMASLFGLRAASLKQTLFRARRRMAALLQPLAPERTRS